MTMRFRNISSLNSDIFGKLLLPLNSISMGPNVGKNKSRLHLSLN